MVMMLQMCDKSATSAEVIENLGYFMLAGFAIAIAADRSCRWTIGLALARRALGGPVGDFFVVAAACTNRRIG